MYYFNIKPFLAHHLLKLSICLTVLVGLQSCSAGKDAKSVGSGGSSPSPLILSFISAPVYNIGTFANGSSNLVWLPISTTGQSTATVGSSSNSDAAFTFNGGTFPGTGGTCASPIGGNCSVAVTFAPTATNSYSNVVIVNYTSAGGSYSASITISATSVPPATLVISDGATYNYGSQVLTTSTDKTFTVTNTGGFTATSLAGSGLAAPFVFKGGTYPGTGGTCGVALSAGVSCTIVATYTPTTAAVHNDQIDLSYHNGVTTTSTNRPVQGTGQSAAILSISDGVTYNYGNVATGAPAVLKTFTVTNSGQTTATLMSGSGLAAPFQFEGGAYPGTTGTCNTSLAGGGTTCTMTVTYAPSTIAVHTDTILLDYFDGAASQQANRPVQGTGVAPTVLTISDGPTWDFGTRVVGSSTDKTFTVTYTGTVPATAISGTGLAAPYTFKGGAFPGTGGTCSTVSISANCLIVVTYAPVGAATHNDTIQIDYNDGAVNTNTTRDMTAIAQTAATLTISNGPTYNFGNVTLNVATDFTFTVTKGGTTAATVINPIVMVAPYSYKGGTFPGTGGTCSAVSISANCTVVVTYTPTTAAVHNFTWNIGYYNGVSTQTATRAMTGTGRSAAVLTISDGATYNYGYKVIGSSTDKTFTVTNSGWSTATGIVQTALSAPYSFKGGLYPGTGGTCGGTLAGSGTTCLIVVTYDPSAAVVSNDTLRLDYNDGLAAQNAQRAITGTGGTVATLSISDGVTYDYGTHGINYATDKTFTISNTGGVNATAISEITMAAPYAFKGGAFPGTGGDCTALNLNPASSCTIVVTFTPTAATSYADVITIEYNNGSAVVNTTRAVNGVGATISQLAGGAEHTCALYSTGEVKCWGADTYGQLGDSAGFASSLTPVSVSGITTATAITAGDNHTCALLSNSRVWCWGRDDQGQLGNDVAFTDSGVPVLVATYTDFVEVKAGGSVTCARRSAGGTNVTCWGNDTEGANGDDVAYSDNTTPQVVSGLNNAVSIAVGTSHACAVRNTGAMRCWGWDSNGQIGDDIALADQPTSVAVSGVATGLLTFAGGKRACTTLGDNSVQCWGSDTYGELGDDVVLTDQPTPVTVGGLNNATSIALGSEHGCALWAAGNVSCWGRDNEGQLGDNAPSADQSTPVATATIANVTAIASGASHSCAVQTNGSVYCWGKNTAGQLGNNSPPASQPTPVLALGL